MLERLVTICSVFLRIDDSRFKILQEKETNRLRHTYCGESFFLRYISFKKVIPSRAARGYRMSGAIGCRGPSWSGQLDGKELRGALGSAIGTERIPVFWTPSTNPSSSTTIIVVLCEFQRIVLVLLYRYNGET